MNSVSKKSGIFQRILGNIEILLIKTDRTIDYKTSKCEIKNWTLTV